MKKQNSITLLVALTLSAMLFTSCNDNNNTPKRESQTEYTIMLYGCGGGNLDEVMHLNLEEALLAGSNEKVKMTGQIKYSEHHQDDPALAGTRRFVLKDENEDGELDDTKFADASLPLHDPDNLADFIKWSKEQCPAKNYILILWNHGGGWLPQHDAPKTRGILFDDNTRKIMSLDEVVEGVKRSDTHLAMIYYDACLMGMLENLYGMKDVADYAMGAAHVTPGMGGEYSSLIENLSTASNLESAMTQYCKDVMYHWSTLGDNLDISLTNLSKLTPVVDVMKKISTLLVDSYDECGEVYDIATDNCYSPGMVEEGFYFFDVMDYVEKLAAKSASFAMPTGAELLKYATELRRAKDAAMVCNETSAPLKAYQQEISWSITVVNDELWDDWYSNGAYEALAFDKATGWSNWLKTNEQLPTNNPSGNYDEDEHQEDNHFIR